MIDLLAALFWAFARRVAEFLGATAGNTSVVLVPFAVMFVAIWFFERRQGSDTSRYVRRNFAHDVGYALFYNSGAFNLLGASMIYAALEDRLGFMRLGLLEGLPIAVVGVLYVVIADLANYWVHRAEHTIPFLWQFHSVHHSSEEISFLTAYRVHPVSRLLFGVSEVVLLILLGVPPTWWLPFSLARGFLATVQHSDLDWSYGPLYPIVVSPVFHRLHHSRDRRDFDSNYAQLFCVWDHLFGTANPSRTPPIAVGVEGLPAERTLVGQFWGPFRRLVRPSVAAEPPQSARPEREEAALVGKTSSGRRRRGRHA